VRGRAASHERALVSASCRASIPNDASTGSAWRSAMQAPASHPSCSRTCASAEKTARTGPERCSCRKSGSMTRGALGHGHQGPALRDAGHSTPPAVRGSAATAPHTGRARRWGSRCCSSRWATAAPVPPVAGRRPGSLCAHLLQQVRRRIDLAHQPAQVAHVDVDGAFVARVEHPAGTHGFPVAVEIETDQFATRVEDR
jgi:hypothetical protein